MRWFGIYVLFVLLTLLPPGTAVAGVREAAEAFTHGDYASALRACRAAAEAGDPSCQNFMGLLYAEGKGVKTDPAEAARWFRLAAEQGHGAAALNLARAYAQGDGIAKDREQAKLWARKAAAQGLPQAQFLLGALLLETEKNAAEAAKWFRAAAAHGFAPAQWALGESYELGEGVRRNERTAAKWYEVAAEQGLGAAAGRLAALYESGRGVELNLEEAYFWYKIALRDAKNPNQKKDQAGLSRVQTQLSKAQLAAAEKALREWHPETAEAAQPPRRKGKRGGESERDHGLVGTGTGFFVSTAGHLLTNHHVAAECREVHVTEGDKSTPAKLIASDAAHDLALLQVAHASQTATFRGSDPVRPGESVVVVGFPLSGLLTSEPIVTAGIVNALAGPRDDRSRLQMSAPIQPGNSGSPLFDGSGRVIGVAVGTLNTIKLAQATGAIPENINFAIKGEEAQAFLKSHGVAVKTAAAEPQQLAPAAIADRALSITLRIECWK
jgi:uncharacterized protein